MALKSEEVRRFKEEGYASAPGFFSEREVAAMQADIARLQREGRLRNVATDGDGKTTSETKRNLQLCPMYPHSTLFRSLPFHPKVKEAVGQLLGHPLILRLDQVFLKPAKDGMGTNWHQDNAYFQIADPLLGTAMWIAVHDATVANGTIHVIPGSFKERFPHSRDPDSDHHIRCYPPEARAVPIELKAGGVAFFCYGTAHCTKGNTTETDRAGVALHFVNEAMALNDPQVRLDPERNYYPYLDGPNATGGLDEYGVRVDGTWDAEVEKALLEI
jgi:ectoine hydroxylase-related dioxygenase (phytanoyl-CoA dioxygenase family)